MSHYLGIEFDSLEQIAHYSIHNSFLIPQKLLSHFTQFGVIKLPRMADKLPCIVLWDPQPSQTDTNLKYIRALSINKPLTLSPRSTICLILSNKLGKLKKYLVSHSNSVKLFNDKPKRGKQLNAPLFFAGGFIVEDHIELIKGFFEPVEAQTRCFFVEITNKAFCSVWTVEGD